MADKDVEANSGDPPVSASLIVGAIIGNVVSTVCVVVLNKHLWSQLGFAYVLLLSSLHFAFTGLCVRSLESVGFFPFKDAKFWDVLPVAVGSMGSVTFMNLSLANNTVGFYQISKLCCIPATLVVNFLSKGETQGRPVLGALSLLLLGVGFATVNDVGLNFVGSVYACIAVMFTVMGQVLTKSKQQDLGLDHMQLLFHVCPIISTGMLFGSPFFDEWVSETGVLHFDWNMNAVVFIFLSCVCALVINVTNYLVIGKTSPVTYQVVGHLKTCLILFFGAVVFRTPMPLKNMFGIMLAVVGMVLYTEMKRRGFR